MADIKLTFDFPPKELLPNKKSHWAVKARVTREAREAAGWMAKKAWLDSETSRIYKCHMTITWYPPDKRRRDYEGMLRATKPIIDGLVDSSLLTDDSLKVIQGMTLAFGSGGDPRTEIEIKVLE